MKKFTYSEDRRLNGYASRWLSDMGLEETLWILNTKGIISIWGLTFKEWIG